MSESTAEWIAYRRAVSEVFHALSQPITALQCSLELAYRRARTAEELQTGLREGLDNSQRLIGVLGWLRKFAEASEPSTCSAVNLENIVRDWGLEMLPIAESLGKSIQLNCINQREALGNEDVVREACMLIGDLALASTSKQIDVMVTGESVQFAISAREMKVESASDMSTLLSQAPELAVAARRTRSINGSFSIRRNGDQIIIGFALPPKSDNPQETSVD